MGKQGLSWVWGLEGSRKDSCRELIISTCQVGLFFPFYRRGSRGSERVSNLLEVTQQDESPEFKDEHLNRFGN